MHPYKSLGATVLTHRAPLPVAHLSHVRTQAPVAAHVADLHILKAMQRSPLGLDLCLTYLTFTLKRHLRLVDAG